MLIDILVSVVLVLIIGGAIAYIVRSKKRGETCIGCPYAKECARGKGGCSGACHTTGTSGSSPKPTKGSTDSAE